MPAPLIDPLGNLKQFISGSEVNEPFDKVESDATNTGLVHRLQLNISDVASNGRNATRTTTTVLESIQHGPIVGAMTGRLHDHIAGDAQMVAQREELLA